MNPLFNNDIFIPDGEAHVMPDGRLYVYGSLDIRGNESYCSSSYHVMSTDDAKLEKWVDHGVAFSTDCAYFNKNGENVILYAPDAVENNGIYYLYYCTSQNKEGVAKADCPYGPFTPVKEIEYASGSGIDPAVFKDDDGQCYYYWGQFSLNGAKLSESMTEIDMTTLHRDLITEHEHGFHEGASVRKHNGKYYLLYTDISRGRATCISYAVSDSPLGPFKKGGVIVDNIYCDPMTWNNHGSMECFKGQWYIFYHRSSFNSQFSRRLCAEKIFFNADGSIGEVCQTSTGASEKYKRGCTIPARSVCAMMGSCCLIYANNSELLKSGGADRVRPDSAKFKYVDLKGCRKITLNMRGKGVVSVYTDGSHRLGEFRVESDEFKAYTVDTDIETNTDCLWVCFYGGAMILSDIEID